MKKYMGQYALLPESRIRHGSGALCVGCDSAEDRGLSPRLRGELRIRSGGLAVRGEHSRTAEQACTFSGSPIRTSGAESRGKIS